MGVDVTVRLREFLASLNVAWPPETVTKMIQQAVQERVDDPEGWLREQAGAMELDDDDDEPTGSPAGASANDAGQSPPPEPPEEKKPPEKKKKADKRQRQGEENIPTCPVCITPGTKKKPLKCESYSSSAAFTYYRCRNKPDGKCPVNFTTKLPRPGLAARAAKLAGKHDHMAAR